MRPGVDHRGRNPARTGAAGGGRFGENRGRGRRVRASRPDSAGGKEAEAAAERLVLVDLHGAAPIDGGTHRKLGGDGGSSEGRESETRGQVGEEWMRGS